MVCVTTNLEMWLRYDFNIPLFEGLCESGTLAGHWRMQSERLRKAVVASIWAGIPCVV